MTTTGGEAGAGATTTGGGSEETQSPAQEDTRAGRTARQSLGPASDRVDKADRAA